MTDAQKAGYLQSIYVHPITQTGLTFLARTVSVGGVLVLTAAANHFMGLEESGEFFKAFVLANFLAILGRWGMDFVLLKEIARSSDTELKSTLFLTIMKMGATLAFILTAVSFIAYLSVDNIEIPLGLVWVPLIPLCLMNLRAAYAKAHGHNASGAMLESGIAATVTAAILVMLFLGVGDISALNVWVIYSAVAWVILLASTMPVIIWASRNTRVKFDLARVEKLDLFFLGSSTALGFCAQWGSILFVAVFLSSKDVAILNTMMRIIAPLQFISATYDSIIAHKVSKGLSDNDFTFVRSIRNKTSILSTLSGLAYLGPLVAFPGALLLFLPPEAIGSYIGAFYLLAVSQMLFLIMGPNGIVIAMGGMGRMAFKGTLLRCILAALLYGAFVPWLGIFGACLGFCLSTAAMLVYYRIGVDAKLKSMAGGV